MASRSSRLTPAGTKADGLPAALGARPGVLRSSGLEQTLARGTVSAVNRLLPGASWSLKEPLIQTDALRSTASRRRPPAAAT
jgi:hypothetical protein